MRITKTIASILLFVILIGTSNESFCQKDLQTRIDKFLTTCYERSLFNGTALIAKGDSIFFQEAYGLSNVEWKIPNSVNTRFDIGSLTKQFVAILTLQMIEDGKLSFNDPISKHLPKYRKDIGDIVTIDHLLKHTSGIKPYVAIEGIDNHLARSLSREESLNLLHSNDLEFKPGERFRYNNSGYCILVYIIEEVLNKSFNTILHERILSPLQMENTGLIDSRNLVSHLANGYVLGLGGYQKPKYLNPNNTYGAGGMYSTVLDIFTWNRAISDHHLLPNKYDSLLFSPYFEFHPGNGHAYSWDITTLRLRDSKRTIKFAHYNGAQWGYLCETARIFEGDYLILLFTNIGHDVNIWSIESGIRNILFNEPVVVPLPSLASALSMNVGNTSFDSIIEYVYTVFPKHKTHYAINEQTMNMLGYKLLWNNDFEQSLKVFTLNTDLFPESANVFDSLGEYYLKLGQNELAKLNYKKSIELNPDNINAIEILKNISSE